MLGRTNQELHLYTELIITARLMTGSLGHIIGIANNRLPKELTTSNNGGRKRRERKMAN